MRKFVVLGAIVAGIGVPATAHALGTPSAATYKSFTTEFGSGFGRVHIELRQTTGATAGTSGSVTPSTWTACVDAWGRTGFIADCNDATAVDVVLPTASNPGRMWFRFRDGFFGGGAVVHVTLHDTGRPDGVQYELPGAGTAAGSVETTRTLTATGWVDVRADEDTRKLRRHVPSATTVDYAQGVAAGM